MSAPRQVLGALRSLRPTDNFAYPLRRLVPKRYTPQPRCHFSLSCGKFVIKIAESAHELAAAQTLRDQIFTEEYGFCPKNKPKSPSLYDMQADHLLVIDSDTTTLVGTYRLSSSLWNRRFYCAEEFDVSNLLDDSRVILELSRACILAEYRSGAVIALLWRGIYHYMREIEADLLLGMSSFRSQNLGQVNALSRYLQSTSPLESVEVLPRRKFDRSRLLLQANLTHSEQAFDRRMLPPLFRAYLKAGARFGAVPAYDPEFLCYDFFTVLKSNELNTRFVARLAAS